MFGYIIIIVFCIWIIFLANIQCTKNAIGSVMTGMCMIDVCARLSNMKVIPKCSTGWNRTLCYHRYTIHPGCFLLMYAMPVDCQFASRQMIRYIDNESIVFTNIDSRAEKSPIHWHDATFNTICRYAARRKTITQYTMNAITTQSANQLIILGILLQIRKNGHISRKMPHNFAIFFP